MKNKLWILIGIILAVVVLIIAVVVPEKQKETKEDLLGISYDVEGNEATLNYDTENPVVALYIEDYGSVVLELYPSVAPNTVNSFISLVKSGFYDNNHFHRLYPGFVLQGGDPTGTGNGGPGYTIRGEFTDNGFQNDLSHDKGVVSMARNSISMDSAGSQFFICLEDAKSLDGQYASFGKVIDGWKNIEKIIENATVVNTDQLQPILNLKKALVDTKGKTYPEPEKIEE